MNSFIFLVIIFTVLIVAYSILSFCRAKIKLFFYKKNLAKIDLNEYEVFSFDKKGLPFILQAKKDKNALIFL